MSKEKKDILVINASEKPIKVELKRSTRGVYSWEIQVVGDDVVEILKKIEGADKDLKFWYGTEEERKK